MEKLTADEAKIVSRTIAELSSLSLPDNGLIEMLRSRVRSFQASAKTDNEPSIDLQAVGDLDYLLEKVGFEVLKTVDATVLCRPRVDHRLNAVNQLQGAVSEFFPASDFKIQQMSSAMGPLFEINILPGGPRSWTGLKALSGQALADRLKQLGVFAWNELRAGAPAWRPCLAFADLGGENLKGLNLSRADLEGAFLQGANLSGSDLSQASASADFSLANLKEADLTGTRLIDAKMNFADLRRARLRKTQLIDADVANANFDGAYLRDANFKRANMAGASFKNIVLKGSFQEAYIDGVKMSGGTLAVLTDLGWQTEQWIRSVGSEAARRQLEPLTQIPPLSAQELRGGAPANAWESRLDRAVQAAKTISAEAGR